MARLSDGDRAILQGFRVIDPANEYQHNAWSPALVSAIKMKATDAGADYTGFLERDLPALVRRGFLAAEGRGRWRQFWLTEKGVDAAEEEA